MTTTLKMKSLQLFEVHGKERRRGKCQLQRHSIPPPYLIRNSYDELDEQRNLTDCSFMVAASPWRDNKELRGEAIIASKKIFGTSSRMADDVLFPGNLLS
jgi:hypothetical protein